MKELGDKLTTIGNEAKIILYRIKLRINPLDTNPTKAEDKQFLAQLDRVIDPMSAAPPNPRSSHNEEIEKALLLGRLLLKREWEVVKGWMRW
jgi:hypothetical protein